MASASSVSAVTPAYTAFADLAVDGDSAIKAMVCRSWDVKNPMGKYIGTEYILSDDAGQALHCVARSAIAHCVVSKLQAGGIYGIRRFSVSPNKVTYRVRRDDQLLINLESNTLIHKLDCSGAGFRRHPFMVTPLEDIAFNNHAFLIDVVGRAVNVGAFKPTRNGSKFLDFELANERGQSVKVALWGALGDELMSIYNNPDALPVVLLPAMNIREYKGDLQLSSTSGTIIFSENNIPEIAKMRELMGGTPVQIRRNYGTLLDILKTARDQVGNNDAQTVSSVCKVKIIGIRQRTPWNYYSCGENGCKKGVTPSGTQFWCDSCEKICEFPIVRYLLRLEVLDDTTSPSRQEVRKVGHNLSAWGDATPKDVDCVAAAAENYDIAVVAHNDDTHDSTGSVQIGDQTESSTTPAHIAKKPRLSNDCVNGVFPEPADLDRQKAAAGHMAD